MTALKVGAGIYTGSIGVLSEGVHSGLDLMSAAVAFVSIRAAGKPADLDHPYGHGKYETISSLLEALLLVVAALWMIWEGIDHLNHPQLISHEGIAIAVLGVSTVLSYLMYRHNLSAAGLTESSAIHVNALHFLADVVAGLGVMVGLALLKWTGWLIIDPLMAFGIAAYVLAISVKQVKRAFDELSDSRLPPEEIAEIHRVLDSGLGGDILEVHDLRTRRAGATRHMDFHLVVCGQLSVNQSHVACDQLEARLDERFPGASVTIHVEPCGHHSAGCETSCKLKRST